MLGHASAAMTLDVYADLFDDDLEAVAVAMSAARAIAVSRQRLVSGAPSDLLPSPTYPGREVRARVAGPPVHVGANHRREELGRSDGSLT